VHYDFVPDDRGKGQKESFGRNSETARMPGNPDSRLSEAEADANLFQLREKLFAHVFSVALSLDDQEQAFSF